MLHVFILIVALIVVRKLYDFIPIFFSMVYGYIESGRGLFALCMDLGS